MGDHDATITITFGEAAIGYAGAAPNGGKRPIEQGCGHNLTELNVVSKWFRGKGFETELVPLHDELFKHIDTEGDEKKSADLEAYILIIHRGALFCVDLETLWKELRPLPWDKKMLNRGRVVNNLARLKLGFGEASEEPNYEVGRGRVIGWDSVPQLERLRDKLPNLMSIRRKYEAEGNLYHRPGHSGIGYHGDTERRVVVGVRLGKSMSLAYQWYHNSSRVGSPITFTLNNGDIYYMSEKASGFDWRQRKVPTLRHAAGAAKYTTPSK